MSTDRRTQIVAGAIELIATRGIRALTHRAVDTRLALPPGSTSYYFRTRQALIEAIADSITTRSRVDFEAAQHESATHTESLTRAKSAGRPMDPVRVAHDIASWLADLLAHRRNELIARHALIIEVMSDPELHGRLAGSLFSLDRATDLFSALGAAAPSESAHDFLALLEGLVFDRFAGLRAESAGTVDQFARPLAEFLTGARDYSARQPNSE
ncbi:TetR/AcrR family transcriptional regulator [Nocardia alba]|uniref:TetR family transcriptional regulator n=1 Tax=Nocardia alba TaxID=225051 RepID=A0A4R1G3E7_9NOCA|nr:TetR/AcrR family transcriptional regulator [Nocardia alba]TCK01211.1 TetR family transcriptional regulator [Nocardia alba]